jgi:hypothetical protein
MIYRQHPFPPVTHALVSAVSDCFNDGIGGTLSEVRGGLLRLVIAGGAVAVAGRAIRMGGPSDG